MKRLIRYSLIVIATFSSTHLLAESAASKLLLLIIDSDGDPIYAKLRHIWSLYMHSDPKNIESYFIRSNPNMAVDYLIEGDTIFLRAEDSLVPGVITKTVMALEALSSRIGTEFNFIIRSNLSSFYIFNQLLKYIEGLPTTKCYSGSVLNSYSVSGCGYIISSDVAQMMIDNKKFLMYAPWNDDDTLGELMRALVVHPIFHPREDYCIYKRDWSPDSFISPDLFQVRVKNGIQEDSREEDIIIYEWLLEKFYKIKLDFN
jgi:hypothetical protein